MMQNFSCYGLFFESDIGIPGAIAVGVMPPDAAPVTIRHSRSADVPHDDRPIYLLEDNAVLFSPPGLGTFRIQPDSITIQLLPDADIEYASALLIATALPALLWFRGHFMLHAAGVILPGEQGVTALGGVSGAGKSTITAALVSQGAKLVGDDSLCVRLDGGLFGITGLPGGQFIQQASQRIFSPTRPDQIAEGAMLERVVILSHEANGFAGAKIQGVEAVELILANQHRPAVPALLGRQGHALQVAARIAQSVPVLHWPCRKGELPVDPQRFRDKVKATLSGDFQ